MLATTTTTFEQVTFDGPISLPVAAVIGTLLLALFGWSLWRERRVLGRQQTVLFWCLRAITLAVVMWMLLAPSKVNVLTSTTRRAVAVIADVSASMSTVDPAGTADEIRWAAAMHGDGPASICVAADRAVAALGLAQQHVVRASELIGQHAPDGDVESEATAAELALRRMQEHLTFLTQNAASGSRTRSVADRLVNSLEGAEFEAFRRLSNSLRRGRDPAEKGWRESLPDLEHRLISLSRTVHELARHAVTDDEQQIVDVRSEVLLKLRRESRLERSAALLESLEPRIARLRENADVRVRVFDQQVNVVPEQSDAVAALRSLVRAEDAEPQQVASTDLASVFEQIRRDRQEQPIAAVFLLSDLAHNAAQTDPRVAAATLSGIPVHVVPVGNTQHVRDLILQSVYAPAVSMRNDDVVIEARLQAYDCEGEVCTVQLLQDGDIVDFREVVLDSGVASRSVRFEQQMPTVGNQKFQVAIVPLQGELTEENNYGEAEVNVTRSDIKVLLTDEMPRWEYRYLAQLFRRDPRIECDELLFHPRTIATGRRAESQAFPENVDDWDQYDVVMLGDIPTARLTETSQTSLIEYLQQRGGTLIMIAGREAMPHHYVDHPLQSIIPVRSIDSSLATADRYVFHVTEDGRDHLALMIGESEESTRTAWEFVNRFSPLHAISDWRTPGPLAQTLISAVPHDSTDPERDAAASAFLCWQPVGRGRIVYLAAPDTWRLRHLRGDRLHYRFWGQLMRWAIASELSGGSKFVRIRTDRSRYDSRDQVRVVVRITGQDGQPVLTDENVEVRLSGAGEEIVLPLEMNQESPGEYLASAAELKPGVYRVEPIGSVIDSLQSDNSYEPASASFTVQADLPMELINTRCDRALAQQIADITGGQVVPPGAIDEVLELTNLEPVVSEVRKETDLWVRWKYLWIVFGCLQTEWIIRKWKGLS